MIPPLEPLQAIDRLLAQAGIAYALGASGLLHALGLADDVHDWDLTTDASVDEVRRALDGLEYEWCGPSGIHTDHKARAFGGAVELIVRMGLRAPARDEIRIPTIETGRWNGIPLGSPAAWAVAYALMERDAKAEMLFSHLAEHPDPQGRARMRAQLIPKDLAERLDPVTRGPRG